MHLLLDLDGTLVDPKPGIIGSVQHALSQLGEASPPADELTWAIGPPLRTTFAKLVGPERAEAALALYREHYKAGAMYDVIVYPGIPDALDSLSRAGWRLIVATAKPHVFARSIVEHLGLSRHVAAVYGPELDGTFDDKGLLLAHVLAREGLAPEQTLMIGDRAFDMTAAARNGLSGIGVTWGYGSSEELTRAGAAILCHTPKMLEHTVSRLSA